MRPRALLEELPDIIARNFQTVLMVLRDFEHDGYNKASAVWKVYTEPVKLEVPPQLMKKITIHTPRLETVIRLTNVTRPLIAVGRINIGVDRRIVWLRPQRRRRDNP